MQTEPKMRTSDLRRK